uniref:Cystinosin homolog n=2 Tax=Magnoliopsida TaxID=3398 RepID=A0A1S4BTE5_TOBAC|nr:PREDICTED: cystinosin homolog [Nicotiana tabacum]
MGRMLRFMETMTQVGLFLAYPATSQEGGGVETPTAQAHGQATAFPASDMIALAYGQPHVRARGYEGEEQDLRQIAIYDKVSKTAIAIVTVAWLRVAMIPVAANDVAFSTHVVALTAFTLLQIAIYDRGNQKVPKTAIAIVTVSWLSVAVCIFVAFPKYSWLFLVSCFNTLQVVMTVIKYIPHAVMNFRRKSTIGFSIGNILLDLFGGLTNYGQMAVQSTDQHSLVNFYGNIGKTLLSLVSIFLDILFIVQHYVLYPSRKEVASLDFDVTPRDFEGR